ncbi:MAG: RHS repeat-associated core domain-containing protein [Candidatus Sumerlaeia bacterium]|nr:RHS repeat-associated core domain-containing protein [Candidatus Sumerlaeia bacterium]
MKKIEDITTYYLYDGYNLLYEINDSGCIITRYTHLPGDVIDFPIIACQAGKRYYYHLDGLNSVYLISDEQGNIVARYSYTPFGEILKKEGTFHSQFSFTSREIDEETGLMYYRFRYYIPQIGRFTQIDPLDLLSGTNLYIYVYNNPLRYIDPLGLQSCGAFPPGSPPISPPNKPPQYNPTQPNPVESTNPNQMSPEQQAQYHINQMTYWGNLGQDALGGGEYNYGNVAIDAAQNIASEISVPSQVSPGLTVIQAAPQATVGAGIFHHNASAVDAILNLPELGGGKGGGSNIPRPFGLGGN